MKASDKLIKQVEKLNQEVMDFGKETGETFVTLYEDINTTRMVSNFKLLKDGRLKWIEFDQFKNISVAETYDHTDEDDIKDTIKFWKAALRRAKKYWATDGETLDKMAEGEIEDIEEA